ncbi:MAG TPA: hypothetical protein VMW62_00080 [Chloroflexota bacterium]|nr:hypothetical protein [Chloroflexota bacterium]
MHDSVTIEQHGIPSAYICTDAFEPTVKAMAEVQGLPDYPYAAVRHPIGRATDAELRAKAAAVVDRVCELLTAGS